MMQMTEFNIDAGQNGMASNQYDLCRNKDGKSDCKGDWMGTFKNPCGAMSEGGTYFMINDYNVVWKLGVCGWESMPDIDMNRSAPICGTAPGGSIFCGGQTCHYYSDATDSWSTTSQMPNYHNDGKITSADGYVWVVGGQSGTANIDRYDPTTDSWTTFDMEQTGLPKEYKGFGITKGPYDNSFMTFEVSNTNHTQCSILNATWQAYFFTIYIRVSIVDTMLEIGHVTIMKINTSRIFKVLASLWPSLATFHRL